MLPSWTATNVSIDIEMISPKQLIGECLDLAAAMLRDLMEVYYQMNTTENPFSSQKNDFSAMVAHVLEPSRCDKLLETFVKEDPKTNKPFVRSWLYELRYLRNAWAHSPAQTINYRQANRAFDTLSLLYIALGGNQTGDLFLRIEFYRKRLLIATAKNYHMGQ